MGAGKGSGRFSCVCYWGCGNAGNQIVWVAFAISACLGAGLIIGGAAGGSNCFKDFNRCRDDGFSNEFCQNKYNDECGLRKYQGLLASGVIIFFFITPLLTSYFCCCATRPLQPGQGETAMVVMTGPPGAGGYPYPNQGYSAPAPGYGHPPSGYGHPPSGYGPPPPGYIAYPPPPPGSGYPQPYPQPATGIPQAAGPSDGAPTVVSGVPYPMPKQI